MIEGPAHKAPKSDKIADVKQTTSLEKPAKTSKTSNEESVKSQNQSSPSNTSKSTKNNGDNIPPEVKKSIAKALNVEQKETEEPKKTAPKKTTSKKVESKPKVEKKPIPSTPKKKEIPAIKQVLQKPVMSFDRTTHNFGRIIAGDEFETKFIFTNTGNAPLEIMNATASCGCTTPVFPFLPIEAGDKGTIGVHYNSKGKLGQQKAEIKLITNISKEPIYVYLDGVVLDKEPEKLNPEENLAKDTIDN